MTTPWSGAHLTTYDGVTAWNNPGTPPISLFAGRVTSTSTARAVTVGLSPVTIPVGRATTTSTATRIARNALIVAVGRATGSSASQPLTPGYSGTVPVGRASETDAARQLPRVLRVGRATTTSEAHAAHAVFRVWWYGVRETDTAGTITPRRGVPVVIALGRAETSGSVIGGLTFTQTLRVPVARAAMEADAAYKIRRAMTGHVDQPADPTRAPAGRRHFYV